MNDFSGRNPGPLRSFDPILGKWIEVNRKYGQSAAWKDIPWAYNERASLSTFAAAAWLAGGIALEEFSETKRRGNPSGHRKRSNPGRCDLYVSIGRRGYIIEAKIIWPSITNANWNRTIMSGLNRARKDVRKYHVHNQEKKLEMLFVVPYINKSKVNVSDKLINSFLGFLKSRKDICSAWTFPEEARNFHWKTEKDPIERNRRYPGTAVLIKPL